MNEKVLRLMQLAMEISQSGKAHAFVDYSGHVDGIYYRAHPFGQTYEDDAGVAHLVEAASIYLRHDGADEKLDAVITQFESLLMGGAA